MKITLSATVPEQLHGMRLDQALAHVFPDYSRAQHQQWIKSGQVSVNQQPVTKTRYSVQSEQLVTIDAELEDQTTVSGEAIPIDIVYEDDDLLIVNKAAGLVVHPGAGNPAGTLVNALLHHAPSLSTLPRAGIVHRLDKDTTGLLVVAKQLSSYHFLSKAMQAREIHREYETIVHGQLIAGGTIDAAIGRHPQHRTKMSVQHGGRTAITHYRIIKKFLWHTHLRVMLETGRTHQIRVHFAHQHHPIVGDPTYGKKSLISKKWPDSLQTALHQFPRQALHARRISLVHPTNGNELQVEAPLPEDMQQLLATLNQSSHL